MIRAVVAAAAFGLCFFLGRRRAVLLKKRAELLLELHTMLCGFAIELRCLATTLAELCRHADGCFAGLIVQELEHSNVREAWEHACDRLLMLPQTGREEVSLLRELGRSLGKADVAGELSLLGLYGQRIDALRQAADEDYVRKGRVFRSVGMLCGLAAAIMII